MAKFLPEAAQADNAQQIVCSKCRRDAEGIRVFEMKHAVFHIKPDGKLLCSDCATVNEIADLPEIKIEKF